MEPFISFDDLQAVTTETLTGTDLLVAIALDSACQMVRDETHRTINLVRDDIELHDGSGREVLVLRQMPLIEVTSVYEDDVLLVEGDDYVVGTYGKLYRRSPWFPFSWSRGRQNIEVTYDHGWAVSEDEVVETSEGIEVDRVPASIRMVALEAASRVIRAPSLAAVASGITGESLGAYSYTASLGAMSAVIAAGLSEEERVSLKPWVMVPSG
jgi:hypothetical protein